MVGVSAENREKARVAGGDEIDVDIRLDNAVREVTVPPDLVKAFKTAASAKGRFEALSYSGKKAVVDGIEGAKTDETRQRRVRNAIDELSAG